MVAHAFPVVKLGIILLQQLSKPAAKVVSNMAVHNRIVHAYLCNSATRFQHFEAKTNKIKVVGHSQRLISYKISAF